MKVLLVLALLVAVTVATPRYGDWDDRDDWRMGGYYPGMWGGGMIGGGMMGGYYPGMWGGGMWGGGMMGGGMWGGYYPRRWGGMWGGYPGYMRRWHRPYYYPRYMGGYRKKYGYY